MATELNIDEVVRQRYEAGAAARQDSLCCPVSYDPRYLEYRTTTNGNATCCGPDGCG